MLNNYNSTVLTKKAENRQSLSNSFTITEVEKRSQGEIIGLTMIPEEYNGVTYGMVAIMPEDFDPDNPIIQISSNAKGENHVYNIEINKINPQDATEMEMFALCSYADKIGKGSGSASRISSLLIS